MRALAAGAFGILVISRAFATSADVVVHLFLAPNSARAVHMTGGGFSEIWFAQPEADSLARVNPDGSITEHPVAPGSRPLGIALWGSESVVFTEVGTNRIGFMDGDGVVTEYDIPTPASDPRGITNGPTGPSVWFTEYDGNRIGRLDLSSETIVEFPVPTFNSGPLGIAQGPGATSGSTDIWFTEYLANKIGRIDSKGVITEYDIPTPDSGPTEIVEGIVANQRVMYFTESKANKIGRITASGRITEYVIPTPNSGPADIVKDEDAGGVWFSERLAGNLGWLSEEGGFREFSLPTNSRPEGIALSYRESFFQPRSVWYVDGTHRRVGRLSGNRLFAVGAGHGADWDTDFEFFNSDDRADRVVEVGSSFSGVCPTICPTSIFVEVPRNGTASTSASLVPMSGAPWLHFVTGARPSVSDVPDTSAWIVGDLTDDVRVELPLIDYWTLVTLQPPLPRGGGPQPALKFPARRRSNVRIELALTALESDDFEGLAVLLEALTPQGDVVGTMTLRLPVGQVLVLDRVLSDLGVFDDFEGHLRVTRVSRSGLFWGVAEIFENDRLTRLMPPGSELDQECSGGPARCGPPRRTRVLTREAGAQIRDESALETEQEEDRDR